MNAAILVIIAFALFIVAYRIYGKYISKVFEENDANSVLNPSKLSGISELSNELSIF